MRNILIFVGVSLVVGLAIMIGCGQDYSSSGGGYTSTTYPTTTTTTSTTTTT